MFPYYGEKHLLIIQCSF